VGRSHSPAVEIDPGDTVTFEINEVTSWPVVSACLPLSVGVSSAPLTLILLLNSTPLWESHDLIALRFETI